jgi:hypothetical protein
MRRRLTRGIRPIGGAYESSAFTDDLFRAAPPVFWIVQAVYFYAIASVVAAIVQKLRRRAGQAGG